MLQALRRLLPYVLRVRIPFFAGLASILAATAISLVAPWVLKYVVDGLTEGVDRTRLAWLAAALPGLALLDGGFRYMTRKWLIGASRRIEYDLRNDFFAHLERLPQPYFQSHRTGDLMSRATNDLAAVRMLVGPAVMYASSTVVGFVLAVGIMAWIDLRLTLIALLPLPFVTLATRHFGRAIHDRFERIQAQLAAMSAVVQESLAGVRVVRAFRQEDFEVARFRAANDEYVERNRGLIRLQAAFHPSLAFCFGLSGLLVLWFGGRAVIAGTLTLGEFVAFSRYLVLLAWPVIAFGWVTNIAQRGIASWERMLEVLDAPAPDDRAADERLPAEVRGHVECRRLTFRYPQAEADALRDVSFEVQPGETLAIVGPTGSGKSTLLSLLARLQEPPRGALFLDGADVTRVPRADLRAAIGMAPQEPFLFSDTVGANVLFGCGGGEPDGARRPAIGTGDPAGARRPAIGAGDVDDGMGGRLRRAAAIAHLDGEVAEFPKGYDTLVGERGVTLSGGQKQRVALARAVATDPRVLILDDTLSAVDTATEAAILRGLRDVRRSRTCLIVSHRVSTVRDADRILVLDEGRVVERGRHDDLVARGGLYADMHERQRLEDEIARS
ncbi:MAG: ABC transporter ATP-binding protein [Vicinamibacterales bacterium]